MGLMTTQSAIQGEKPAAQKRAYVMVMHLGVVTPQANLNQTLHRHQLKIQNAQALAVQTLTAHAMRQSLALALLVTPAVTTARQAEEHLGPLMALFTPGYSTMLIETASGMLAIKLYQLKSPAR